MSRTAGRPAKYPKSERLKNRETTGGPFQVPFDDCAGSRLLGHQFADVTANSRGICCHHFGPHAHILRSEGVP
jgi:hypothetical protein